MANTRHTILVGSIVVYAVLWAGGVISSVLWGEAPEGARWAAPVFLYLATVLVLWSLRWRNRVLLLLVGVYGFATEVVGESTGFPFGSYKYTETLGPALFDVPLALISAWVIVTAFVSGILIKANVRRYWWVVVGPLLMVGVDMLLEPVATGPMDAWVWESTGDYYGVPLTNFLGWFGVSVPIFGLLALSKFDERNGVLAATSVIVFFQVLAIVHVLWGALLVSVGGVLAVVIIHWAMMLKINDPLANARADAQVEQH